MPDAGVQHGREQIVGRPDSMDVTSKMQVEVFHGYGLGVATAGGHAFDPKGGPHGGLADGADDVLMPGFLEKAMTIFEKHPEIGLCCSDGIFNWIEEPGKRTSERLIETDKPYLIFPPHQ